MPRKLHILPFFLPLLAAACSPSHQSGGSESEPMRINRLDLRLASTDSLLDARDQKAFEAWKSILGREYSREDYAASPAVVAFEPLVIEQLPPLDSIERVLGEALAGVDSVEIHAVVSPYNQAVVTHPDGFVFIALNHYLGPDNPIYSGRFAEYERNRKSLKRLPADVIEALTVSSYPAELADDAPLLNRMLYQGAVLQTVLDALPDGTPESTVLAMSPEDYNWCVANEGRLWNALIERQILYSTDPGLARRLLMPAPASSAVLPDAPGQAILFTAMRIIKSYLNNNAQTSPEELLIPEFYNSNQSLIDSKYTPANAPR